MTKQEALTELKASIEGCGFQCHIETYREAIVALEKQIPKAPVPEGTDEQDYILCPICSTPVGSNDDYDGWNECHKYCPSCGQALDWGRQDV